MTKSEEMLRSRMSEELKEIEGFQASSNDLIRIDANAVAAGYVKAMILVEKYFNGELEKEHQFNP